MGLLPSSRRKQSRDLGDCAADGDYVYANGSGRRRRSWKVGTDQSSVRLVRLSSGLNVVGSSRTAHSGTWAGSVVLQNGGDKGLREVQSLLTDTQPVARWQERLVQQLSVYIMPHDVHQALAFWDYIMNTAIAAIRNPSQSLGYPALYIDINQKPAIFDLQHWKSILISLHFELTEPESNRRLDLVEVKVTTHVSLESLLGFKALVQSLSRIDWNMFRMLLALNQDEALQLLAVMQSPQDYNCGDMPSLHTLNARYPEEMEALGFSVSKVGTLRKRKQLVWHPPRNSDPVYHMEVALMGLFHNGSGLETFI